ncbi:MAG: OmpA family protein [Candidatus Hydrogenedentota bacterium]
MRYFINFRLVPLIVLLFILGCFGGKIIERRPDPEIERLNREIDALESARDEEITNISDESERRLKILWKELERLKQKHKDELGNNKVLYEQKLKELEEKIVELRKKNLDELKQLQIEKEALEKELEKYAKTGDVTIFKTDEGITVRFPDRVFFDSGKAVIKPEGKEVLDKVINVIKKFQEREIRIEGHTDNVPINTYLFPSNWELSTGRSVVVLRYLVEKGGVSPLKVSAIGYGEYHPITTNDTDEGRAKNRRVDIIFISKQGEEDISQ